MLDKLQMNFEELKKLKIQNSDILFILLDFIEICQKYLQKLLF